MIDRDLVSLFCIYADIVFAAWFAEEVAISLIYIFVDFVNNHVAVIMCVYLWVLCYMQFFYGLSLCQYCGGLNANAPIGSYV